jgi:alpha-ketoglutarate-dependent taurine dioxygenase
MATAADNILITRETGSLGATVSGLDLRVEQPEAVRGELDHALHEHGVLFVRYEGQISDEDHKRFASIFGHVRRSLYNSRAEVSVVSGDVRVFGTDRWHADSTAVENPPQAAVLRAVVLPPSGW